jgi:hypothetical protein
MDRIPANLYAIANLLCFLLIFSSSVILTFFCLEIKIWLKILIAIILFFVMGIIQHKILVIPVNALVKKLFFSKYREG